MVVRLGITPQIPVSAFSAATDLIAEAGRVKAAKEDAIWGNLTRAAEGLTARRESKRRYADSQKQLGVENERAERFHQDSMDLEQFHADVGNVAMLDKIRSSRENDLATAQASKDPAMIARATAEYTAADSAWTTAVNRAQAFTAKKKQQMAAAKADCPG